MKKIAMGMAMLLVIMLMATLLPACAKPAPAPAPAPAPTPAPAPAPAPKPAVAPHPMVNLQHMAGGRGTSASIMASAIEDMLKKEHPWLRAPCAVTTGSAYNHKVIDSNPALWTTAMNYTDFFGIWAAEHASPPFDTKIIGHVPLYSALGLGLWLASLNPKITTVNDLIGKKIALGGKMQVSWCMPYDIILKDGLEISDKVQITYVGNHEAMLALLDGLADVAVLGGYCNLATKEFQPAPDLIEAMASGKKMYAISFPQEAFDKARKKSGAPLMSWLMPVNEEFGMYQPTNVINNQNGVVVKDVFPEDIAYEFIKFLIGHVNKLKDYHSLGKLMTRESLPMVNTIYPLHPGARRAFEEAKIPIPATVK